ncbi:MAG TPA: phospholipid scramblase-related protein [Myxococcota bacterium]
MSALAGTFIAGHPQLSLKQRKEWVEILVDFETRNQYAVFGSRGEEVGTLAEEGGGLGRVLTRWLLRSHRPLDAALCDRLGAVVLRLSRPFFFLFSDLNVSDARGVTIGSVHRRFGILYRKYDLRDAHGRTFARVKSPFWRIWTFFVRAEDGRDATIGKKWGGVLREVFADADTFGVDFSQASWAPEERAVIFAAAVSIDFDFFENNQGVGGVFGASDIFG